MNTEVNKAVNAEMAAHQRFMQAKEAVIKTAQAQGHKIQNEPLKAALEELRQAGQAYTQASNEYDAIWKQANAEWQANRART